VTPALTGAFTVGALVQTNFGQPEELRFGGVHIGRLLQPPRPSQSSQPTEPPQAERGSVMVVLATDAPLDARQLHRLCVRAGAGLARTGATIGHGSGDFAIAFSTTRRIATGASATPVAMQSGLGDEAQALEGLLPAVVESVEEAVLNSLCAAETVVGRDGHIRHALPVHLIARQLPPAS
jgi:D-aminopeptidase